MRPFTLFLLLLLSFGLPLPGQSPGQPPAAAQPPSLRDQTAAWAAALGHGAVATAGKRDGRWSFTLAGQPFAAGHAEVPPERVLFEIGSITKVFTGILLADSVVAGKLGLDDTLAQRLPVKFDHAGTGAVTLKQLATHTSCLPRLPDNLMNATAADPYAQYDRKAMFEYLATAKLAGQAPCPHEYSNLGFGILGVVLEIAHGKPWAALVQEKIAGPLGMVDTVQELSPEQRSRFAEPWAGAERAQPWTFQAIAGAGALRSTLADMSKFADALMAGAKGPLGPVWPLLAGAYVDVVGGKIGLALAHTNERGADNYSHEGGTGGYRSIVYVRPASGLAVVVLASNATAAPSAWLTALDAAEHPPVARSEIVLPAAVLDEYVGVYPLDPSARFTILRRGDGLIARVTGQSFLPLFASAKDELFYKAVDAQISFRRNPAGAIDGLTIHQSGRELFAPRDAAPVPHIEFPNAAALADYVGEYDFGQFQPGGTISVNAMGEVLMVTLTGQPAFPVFSTGKDRFDYDIVVATLTFERDPAGKVVAVTLHQNGRDMRAPRR